MPWTHGLPGEYVKDSKSETIHITRLFTPAGLAGRRTLCGRPTTEMVMLDETLSGIMASCRRCKERFRATS
jgi:hypothetical protein